MNVTIPGGTSAPTVMQLVISGQAQVGRMVTVTQLTSSGKGVPAIAFSTITQEPFFDLISSKAKPVRSPHDLVGQTCGVVTIGGAYDAQLSSVIVQAGLDPHSVHRLEVQNGPSTYAMLEQGAFARSSTATAACCSPARRRPSRGTAARAL